MRMMTMITESYTTENNITKRYTKISNAKSIKSTHNKKRRLWWEGPVTHWNNLTCVEN